MACIPARVLFSQLSQYLAAQGIVKPSMQVALIGLAVNLGLGLVLVVGVPFEHFPANASAAGGAAPKLLSPLRLRLRLRLCLRPCPEPSPSPQPSALGPQPSALSPQRSASA